MGRRVRQFIGVLTVVGLALPVAQTPSPIFAADPAPVTLAADTFSRSVATGWGAAETGGGYDHEGNPGAFSVDGQAGVLTLPRRGASRAALLNANSARDTDALVRVRINQLPVAGGLWVYAPARRSTGHEYRPKLIVAAGGGLSVHAGIVVNNSESSLGPQVVLSGVTITPGSSVWLRSSVSGANPTTISVKAWRDGTPEPGAWQFSATNSNAALQGAGGVGLRAYVSASNVPFDVVFDDLEVVTSDLPAAPVADFEWSQPTESLTVDFSDTSSGAPTAWSWDFGDGSGATEQHPSHTYATQGSYTVTLSVTAPGGSATASRQIEVEPPPPTPPAPVTLAADTFSRTATGSWAVADEGGLYSYQGGLSEFSVDGQAGVLLLPQAGATRSAFLFGLLADDVDVSFSVATNKSAAGSSIYVYASLRRNSAGWAYRPKLRIAPNGNVFAHVGRMSPGGESSLGPEVRVAGLAHAANAVVHFRAQAVGLDPTTIRVKAWADGTPEPDGWHYTATDSTAQLQSAAAAGVLAHVASGSTAGPVRVRFDDLLVTTMAPIDRVEGETFVGAGDIAVCGSSGDEATSALIGLIEGTVFTAGDNTYPDGTAADFANCYDPAWGRHKIRTYPALGNHEYHAAANAGPYFDYFGAVAGEPGKGWYAYDVGTWRIYMLNSNCGFVGCTAGSEQEQWLRAELAANPRTCSAAVWHHPRYSSATTHGSTLSVQPFWQALYEAGVELVLSGHDHDYERFAPLDATGALDPVAGVRQFVVGTGGVALRTAFAPALPGTQVRQASSHGVLKLILGDGEYEWEFIPIAGQLFTDRGSASCH